jgi:hypothetical protein
VLLFVSGSQITTWEGCRTGTGTGTVTRSASNSCLSCPQNPSSGHLWTALQADWSPNSTFILESLQIVILVSSSKGPSPPPEPYLLLLYLLTYYFQAKDRRSLVSVVRKTGAAIRPLMSCSRSIDSLWKLHQKAKAVDSYFDSRVEPNTTRAAWNEIRDNAERGTNH